MSAAKQAASAVIRSTVHSRPPLRVRCAEHKRLTIIADGAVLLVRPPCCTAHALEVATCGLGGEA